MFTNKSTRKKILKVFQCLLVVYFAHFYKNDYFGLLFYLKKFLKAVFHSDNFSADFSHGYFRAQFNFNFHSAPARQFSKMTTINKLLFLQQKFLLLLILRRREEKGEFKMLVKDLQLFDHEFVFRNFRMRPSTFEKLLSWIWPAIRKSGLRQVTAISYR